MYEDNPKDLLVQRRCEHKVVTQLLRTASCDASIMLNNDPSHVTQGKVGRILSRLAKRDELYVWHDTIGLT